jgi:DNA-directed RNA polymerase subunit omega
MKSNIVDNKYRKVLVASQRVRQLEKGARPLLQSENMKRTFIALREVEQGLISFEFISDPKDLPVPRA